MALMASSSTDRCVLRRTGPSKQSSEQRSYEAGRARSNGAAVCPCVAAGWGSSTTPAYTLYITASRPCPVRLVVVTPLTAAVTEGAARGELEDARQAEMGEEESEAGAAGQRTRSEEGSDPLRLAWKNRRVRR